MKLGEFRNMERELHTFQVRIGVAGFVVMGAFALLFLRFVYLQVMQHARLYRFCCSAALRCSSSLCATVTFPTLELQLWRPG